MGEMTGILSGSVLLLGSTFAFASIWMLHRLLKAFEKSAQRLLDLHIDLMEQMSVASNIEAARFRESCKARDAKSKTSLKPKPELTEDDRAVS